MKMLPLFSLILALESLLSQVQAVISERSSSNVETVLFGSSECRYVSAAQAGNSIYCSRNDNVITDIVTDTIVAGSTTGYIDGHRLSVAQFQSPEGIVIMDESGPPVHRLLYVADRNNNAIRKVEIGNLEQVTTLTGTGSAGWTDGQFSLAKFNRPKDLVIHPQDENLFYVADTDNHAIRFVDSYVNIVSTFAGTPAEAATRDGSLASARFYFVDYITATEIYGMLRLYTVSTLHHVVREIETAVSEVRTIGGVPQTPGYQDGGVQQSLFNNPKGITMDSDAKVVHIADFNNSAIRSISGIHSIHFVVQTVAGGGVFANAGAKDGLGTVAWVYKVNSVSFNTSGHTLFFSQPNSPYPLRRVSYEGIATMSPTSSPTSTFFTPMPSIEGCFSMIGPSNVWVQSSATFEISVQCETNVYPVMWDVFINYSPIVVPGGTAVVTLDHQFLGSLLNTAENVTFHTQACTQAPIWDSSANMCGFTSTVITRERTPSISISASNPFLCGKDNVLQATIVHSIVLDVSEMRGLGYKWRIFQVSGTRIEIPLQNSTKTSLFLQAGTLNPGETYEVEFKVDMMNVYNKTITTTKQFTTGISELIAIIKGGVYRDIRAAENITLDASPSYDPDLADGQSSYSWTCERRITGSNSFQACGALPNVVTNEKVLRLGNTISTTGGFDYRFTVNYSVISLGQRVRSKAANAVLTVKQAQLASLELTAKQPIIPRSGKVRLIANSKSAINIVPSRDLTYTWTYGASVDVPGTASLVYPAVSLVAGTHEFTVTVTDLQAGTNATAAVLIKITDIPEISQVSVDSSTGTAYVQVFTLTVAASSLHLPLRYRFSYNDTVEETGSLLSSYGLLGTMQTTLPIGYLTIIASVQDAVGGVNTGVSSVINVVPASPAVDIACNKTKDGITAIRAVFELPDGHALDSSVLSVLREEGRYATMAKRIDFVLKIIESSTNGIASVPLSTCSDIDHVNGVSTTGGYFKLIWSMLSSELTEMALIPDAFYSSGEQIIQALTKLTKSQSADLSTTNAERIMTSINGIVASTPDNDVITTQIGLMATEGISNLLVKSSASISCQTVDGIISTAENIFKKSGNALTPGSAEIVSYQTDSFSSNIRSLFADTPALSQAPFATVVTPGFNWSEITRPFKTLSISTFDSNVIGKCRGGEEETSIQRSNITSVVFGEQGASLPQSMTVTLLLLVDNLEVGQQQNSRCSSDDQIMRRQVGCEFWNIITQSWSSEGCTFNRTIQLADGRRFGECVCNHLTEFAVVSRQLKCDEAEEPKIMYLVFTGLYVAVSMALAVQIFRIYHLGKLMQHIGLVHILALLVAVFRIPSCVLLSQVGTSSGYSVSSLPVAVTFAIVSLPYCFTFWMSSNVALQWVAIIHNYRMSRTPFEHFETPYMLVNIGVVVAFWAACLVFIVGRYDEAIIAGSVTMAVICMALSLMTIVYGMKISKTMLSLKTVRDKASWMGFRALVIGAGLCGQSITWLASVWLEGSNLTGASAIYLALDVLTLIAIISLYFNAIFKPRTSRPNRSRHATRQNRFISASSPDEIKATSARSIEMQPTNLRASFDGASFQSVQSMQNAESIIQGTVTSSVVDL